MKKILIDCAPGVSDALALLLLRRCEDLELTAVTTGYGRCDAETAFRNAKALTAVLGLDVPVARGAEKPLFGERLPEEGKADRLEPLAKEYGGREPAPWAWDEIYRQAIACQGELTILAAGPLTNLAIALFRYEDLPRHIRQIVFLGGSAESGDVTEFGEFNAVSDPHAVQAVLQSGIPIRMLGLDALETVRLSQEEFARLQEKLPAPFAQMEEARRLELAKWAEPGVLLPGAALAAVSEKPELGESVSRYVRVETVRSGMYGRTIVDVRRHSKDPHNADVIGSLNKEAFLTWLEARLPW